MYPSMHKLSNLALKYQASVGCLRDRGCVHRVTLRPNRIFFTRADLWISVSRAKFDQKADFEVHSAAARQKQSQMGKKWDFQSRQSDNLVFFFSASKAEISGIVWNPFWQSLIPIRAMFEEFATQFSQAWSYRRPIYVKSNYWQACMMTYSTERSGCAVFMT